MNLIPERIVLGSRVDATTYADATDRVINWAKDGRSAYVIVATVNNVMENFDHEDLRQLHNKADLVTPDGMPLVWSLKFLGVKNATRVYGPTLTLHVCEEAARQKIPIALYGGTPDSLKAFSALLEKKFPGIEISCQISPPFRPLTPEEDEDFTRQIVESGARIVFVGIGAPKQEKWMSEHRGRIPAAMLGVGAAFDFHSGRVRQAPAWMQNIGMEWFFRLMMEPRRLWKRYAKHNPRFVWHFFLQLIGARRYDTQPPAPTLKPVAHR